MMGATSSRRFSLVACVALLTACTTAPTPGSPAQDGGDSIAGTYNCGLEGGEPEDVVVLDPDGTVTITPAVGEVGTGTWTLEGDRGAFTFDGQEDPFTVEGDNLVFADPGAADRLVCTPAD
jgi:hypothetical protein